MDLERLQISDRKIIIGIDFGTTFTGVAWAQTQKAERRTAITTWPLSKTVREGESSDKVPTKIRYSGGEVQWGFSVPITAPPEEVIEWFKLDLEPSLRPSNQVMPSATAKSGRTVDSLITDYMSAVGEHLMYTLREKLGEGLVKNASLEFVITVPAIWTERAKERTKKACQAANGLITSASIPVHLVSEPEAAAIYALHGLDPHSLGVNDTIVVVDAGGGTVDLISYRITKLKPILEVEEAAPGSGALCGSTFLNMRFAKFLKAKLGSMPGFDDEVLAEAVECFEKKIKRQFTLSAGPEEVYNIPVPGLPNNRGAGISRGRYSLKAADLKTIFEPVVLEVIKLIKDQITVSNKSSSVPVKAVLLVGGFGASAYLKERTRNSLGSGIQILQPPNAWQAVVQGAVMKGLANAAPESLTSVKVINRKARKHYGVELGVWYDANAHKSIEDEKYWDAMDGFYRIRVMHWFIKKGHAVYENKPFLKDFNQTQKVSEGRINRITMTVYSDSVRNDASLTMDNTCQLLARVEADLSHIPERMLPKSKGDDGQMYYKLECQIESVYLSASTRYTLIYNNERYDTVTAEYV